MLRVARPFCFGAVLVAATLGLTACSSSPKTATHTATSAPESTTSTLTTSATSASAAATQTCASSTTVPASKGGAEVSPPGDIPDNQAFVAFSPADNRYTVKVPEGWARADAAAHVTFTDKLNVIDIVVVAAAAAPTTDSAKIEEPPKLAATTRCFQLVAVNSVSRKAGPVVLIRYKVDALPDPVTGKTVRDDVERYEFWRNGTLALVTLSAPAGSDNVDPWKIVTDSFAWR